MYFGSKCYASYFCRCRTIELNWQPTQRSIFYLADLPIRVLDWMCVCLCVSCFVPLSACVLCMSDAFHQASECAQYTIDAHKKKIKATAHICGVITHCCASVLPIFEQFSYHFFGLLLLQKVEERASKINKIGTQIDWRMWSSSMYIIKCIDSYICYNCRFSRMLSISIDRLTTTTTTKYNDIVSLFRHSQKSISMP